MSGEEAAETIETTEVTPEASAEAPVSEITPNDTSEEQSSEVSLESIHSMSDDELDSFLALGTSRDDPQESEAAQGSEQLHDSSLEQEEPETEELTETEEEEPSESEEEESEVTEGLSYEDAIEKIFKTPFKANGREIQIESADEAIQLMQKGLGYNKDMAELKPFKKAMNVLKKRNALDPEKLDFLLDVAEGKPEAISKLLKDQNVDPYDIDVNAADEYKSEYEDTESFDNVTEIIDSLPEEPQTEALKILSSKGWDDDSKKVLFGNPQALQVLTSQMINGQYEQIVKVVDKQMALGNLNMSYLDAYNMVGNELAKQGKLGVPNTPTERTSEPRPKKQVTVNKQEQRKKAAGAPRKAPSNVPEPEVFNPATATDEEVEKFLQDHLRNSG